MASRDVGFSDTTSAIVLPGRTTSAQGTDDLFDSWSELVKQLALGPAPQLRRCP